MLSTYVKLGFDHILDVNGYDHILFVIVLCVAYKASEWKKMLVLITAFTIGHCVTLGLAAMGVVKVNATLIETLIPITIIISAILNIVSAQQRDEIFNKLNYALALGFGLIHGLGFSNFFKSLVMPDESILPLLFSFNVGVELGQIAIVAAMFALMWVATKLFGVESKYMTIGFSSVCGLLALGILTGVL